MKHKYLLMELVGNDLDDLKSKAKKQCFSIKSVLMIGLQVIDRLEVMHKIGYLHRDVKPDNLAIGLAEKNKIIYLFDFGLAWPKGSPPPKQEKGRVVGTLGFMSLRAHEGKLQGAADDIEAMLYTLLYLAEGTLPWLKLKINSPADFHKIMMSKKMISKKSFKNENIPNELFQLVAYVQSLSGNEAVDYLKIKFKLLQALKRRKETNDFVFDWCQQTGRKSLSADKNKKKGYSPEDTDRQQKKQEIMREQNQQIIQNDIYEVYKFMEKEDKQGTGKQKKEVPRRHSPKKAEKLDPKVIKPRPASAIPRPQTKKQEKPTNPWDLILEFEKKNTAHVPKIVINKTAKHKI